MNVQPHSRRALRRVVPMLSLASVLLFGLLAALVGPGLVQAADQTIAPPASPDFTASGEAWGNNFGFAVAPAGDVNGDGYADVIVGAYNANKAYVYSGTADGLTHPAFYTITKSGGQFGYAVAGGGDLDLNGADDFLVGAPNADVNSTTLQAGLVYVYTGTVNGLPTEAITLTGEAPGDRFGWSVAIAGDVNGDGYADVVVGAWKHDSDTGRVYIYHGSPEGVTNTVQISITGQAPGDGFGISVAGAGDVNGDGYDDIIVGAWQNDEGGLDAGKAYVFYGTEDGITTTNASMVTGEISEQLGTSVSRAGDVNGDGYADVIIGSDAFNPITPTNGLMRVHLGSPSGLITTPQIITLGETDNDHYGFTVSGGGDLNGDGFDDVMVGAYHYGTDDLLNTGKAYIYAGCYGGVQPSPIFTATGEYDLDYYGRAVALTGDVNGDGLDDVLVGAFGGKTWNGAFNSTGKAYGYHGARVGTCEPQIVLTKTVGLAGQTPLCSDAISITVPVSTPVAYCYQVQNTGDITLTHHFIDDQALEGLQVRVPYTLGPGMSYTHIITHTPAHSATNTITWTSIISVTAPDGAPSNPPGRVISATATATTTVTVQPVVEPEPDRQRIFLPHLREQPWW